jgi:hypothetical protein
MSSDTPESSQPNLPGSPEGPNGRQRRGKGIAWKIVGGIVAFFVVVGIIGAIAGGDDDKSSSPSSESSAKSASKAAAAAEGSDVGPRVTGTIQESLFVSGDAEARANMQVTRVWCRWSGEEVEIGATFHNGMATHVTVHVQPNYRLLKAGLHGDGLTSDKDVGVDAGATRVWSEKIGNPDNVDGSPRITSCEPEINSVDLG